MASVSAQPWEQQTGETARAFAAFVAYRSMATAERSLRAVCRALYPQDSGRTKAGRNSPRGWKAVSGWSTRWHWVSRARAWDQEQDRAKRQAQLREAARMGKRHAQQAEGFLEMLKLPVVALQRKLTGDDRERTIASLSAHDAKALVKLVLDCAWAIPSLQKAERKARGADDIDAGDVVTVEDLQAIQDEIIRVVADAVPADRQDAVAGALVEAFNRIGSKELD